MAKLTILISALVLLSTYVAAQGGLLISGNPSSPGGNTIPDDRNNTQNGNITQGDRNITENGTKVCITCAIACEYGHEMGNDGCPKCKCIQPCENVTCSSGKKCEAVADHMCGATACANTTYTAKCIIDDSTPCGKCAKQCPYGFSNDSCAQCKCIDPCATRQCLTGTKCQVIPTDMCGDEPCANNTYMALCVPGDYTCQVPCLKFCEFGFVIGSNGCPICQCSEPCKNVTCEYGTKCTERADRWCGAVPCINSTYSPHCDLCTPCQKFCPFGNYKGNDGCPSCDCLEPCRGAQCKEGFRCRAKASIMCGAEACANATYYPECIENVCTPCANSCPYGYNIDSFGCPNCECREPCKNVHCDEGYTCAEVADKMCGSAPCSNSTYSGRCVSEVNKCSPCPVSCPFGSVMGVDDCPTCVCVQPCRSVQCASGLECVEQMRPLCGSAPCANATYVGVCMDADAARNLSGGNRTQGSSYDNWGEFGLEDTTYLKQEVQICEGEMETLSCPEEQTILIVRAFYGRNSSTACLQGSEGATANLRFSLPDATNRLVELCDGKQTCEVSPDMEIFGRPRAVVPLYIKADYLCQPRVYKTLQCSNSGRMRLQCQHGTTLNIISAFYGRDDMNTTCPHPFAITTNNCSNPKAFDIVKQLCNGHPSCYVGADAQSFSDPCPHSNKYLRLEYECLGCSNAYGDDGQCQFWANQGFCESNHDWMMSSCRKACTRCETEPLPCLNAYDDAQCDIWAASNECTKNANFMYAYCRKSCLKCDSKTACANKYNDTACDIWMQSNQCQENMKFMFPVCTKSCFYCSSSSIRCENKAEDKMCDLWAMSGECDKNPSYMISQCYKSCFNCDKDPVCENKGASDEECALWASQEQCVKNPTWMHTYCWKACMQCQGPRACSNSWSESWCEYAALQGYCSYNNVFDGCYKSCSRCSSTSYVGDCMNTNDSMCVEMVNKGMCVSDPVNALRLCKRSCSMCDQPTVYTSSTGGGLLPGDILDEVSGYTVITPDPIKTRSRLAYVSAFFVSNSSFYLQLWRPWGDSFYLAHNQYVTPQASNIAQTIPIENCVQTSAGDRIGFTTIHGPPAIATTFDPEMAAQKAYLRLGTKQDKFTQVGFSVRFSINAHVVPGHC